jgi:N-acetyl-anhydromuramyl-L-alanine amidase AmpD
VAVGVPADRGATPPGARTSVAPSPALDVVTAPAGERPQRELDRLAAFPDQPGAVLRRAWLLQETGAWGEARTLVNGLLFDGESDSPDVEALARYVRARGYEHEGDNERAARDRDDALALVRSPALRARLVAEGAGGRTGAPPTRDRMAVGTPTVLPRSAWKAAQARVGNMNRMGRIQRVTVHHSATVVRSTSTATSIAAIRGIQRHHQQQNGWGDIGYHYLIDPAGRVWTGRGIEWQGAHAGDPSRNRANVGICLLGSFVPDEQGAPPPAQLAALEALLVSLCVEHRLEPSGILTHKELKDTACPGPYVQAAVEAMRSRLNGQFLAQSPEE